MFQHCCLLLSYCNWQMNNCTYFFSPFFRIFRFHRLFVYDFFSLANRQRSSLVDIVEVSILSGCTSLLLFFFFVCVQKKLAIISFHWNWIGVNKFFVHKLQYFSEKLFAFALTGFSEYFILLFLLDSIDHDVRTYTIDNLIYFLFFYFAGDGKTVFIESMIFAAFLIEKSSHNYCYYNFFSVFRIDVLLKFSQINPQGFC